MMPLHTTDDLRRAAEAAKRAHPTLTYLIRRLIWAADEIDRLKLNPTDEVDRLLLGRVPYNDADRAQLEARAKTRALYPPRKHP